MKGEVFTEIFAEISTAKHIADFWSTANQRERDRDRDRESNGTKADHRKQERF